MKIDRDLLVSYGRTFNLGNFESERVDIGISRDLEEGESRKEAMKEELIELMDFVEKFKDGSLFKEES